MERNHKGWVRLPLVRATTGGGRGEYTIGGCRKRRNVARETIFSRLPTLQQGGGGSKAMHRCDNGPLFTADCTRHDFLCHRLCPLWPLFILLSVLCFFFFMDQHPVPHIVVDAGFQADVLLYLDVRATARNWHH